MDVKCATCGEPWDTHHLRQDEVYETEAGQAIINDRLDREDFDEEQLQLPPGMRGLSKFEPKYKGERWERVLTPFWREQFRALGWEFGTSVVSVLRCSCCADNEELPEAEARRENVQLLSELLEGDEDAQVSDNELALRFI